MVKLGCYNPRILENMDHQTELTPISDEDFDKVFKKFHLTWPQLIYQSFIFITIGWIRAAIGIVTMVIACLIINAGSILFRDILHVYQTFEVPFLTAVCNIGFRTLLYGCGIMYIREVGTYDPECRFIIANHTAIIDPIMIVCRHRTTPVIRKQVSEIKFVERILHYTNTIFIERGHAAGQSELIKEAADNNKLSPVMIFPEGTITKGDYMYKFRKGAFLTNHKVQPICIRYHMPLVPEGLNFYRWQNFHFLVHFWCMCTNPFTIATLEYLPAVTLQDFGEGDPEKFALKMQLLMANHLKIRAIDRSSHDIFDNKQNNKIKKE